MITNRGSLRSQESNTPAILNFVVRLLEKHYLAVNLEGGQEKEMSNIRPKIKQSTKNKLLETEIPTYSVA